MNDLSEVYFTGILVGLLIAWPVWRLLQVVAELLARAYDYIHPRFAEWRASRKDRNHGPVREEQAPRRGRRARR